jgi:hypothetical protein
MKVLDVVETLPDELAYQYKYSVPGIRISWETLVAKLSAELQEDPKPIEITIKGGNGQYDEFLEGELIGIFLTRSKLCMLSSNLNIEPLHIRRDAVMLPIMFSNGRFFFQVKFMEYMTNFTIYL